MDPLREQKQRSKQESFLLEFYGQGCPYCKNMDPLIERLEKETGVKVSRYEVWHNAENQKKLNKYVNVFVDACGGQFGVPAFYNKRTGEPLCGQVDYVTLKEWALRDAEHISYVT